MPMTLETSTAVRSKPVYDLDSPHFFGAEGDPVQETLIADQPLEVTKSEYDNLVVIGQRVADFIKDYRLEGKASAIGADVVNMEKCLQIDKYGNSLMRYGGLDIYQDPGQGFKILEINPRVQAIGLQDYRQEELEIKGQPAILNDLLDWTKANEFKNITILGSKKNPFWRAYERIKNKLAEKNIPTEFLDVQTFVEKARLGYVPDLILKFCSNEQFLDGQYAGDLQKFVEENKTQIVNPLHASYFGYRGFLTEITHELSDLFPDQYLFGSKTSEDDLKQFSWVKLEASGFEYVVNFNELRKWGKDALRHLISGNTSEFEKSLAGKEGGDAHKLRQAKEYVDRASNDQVVWLGQSTAEPRSANLKIAGVDTKVKILHRVYWFLKDDGKVNVSLEGFGCEDSQFQRSKGKINAGTGFSVPMVITS